MRFTSQENFTQIAMDFEEIRPTEKESAHAGILQNFAGAILRGEPLLSPGEDGVRELTLSNAAYLSQWLGNRKIDLPFDTALFDRMLAEKAADSAYVPGRSSGQPDGRYGSRWQVNW